MANFDSIKIHSGLSRTLYRGVGIQKFPFDYLMYQMIIWEVKPDLIIEIGTMHGGSALYLADLLVAFGLSGEVHTIDMLTPKQRYEYEQTLEDHRFNPMENEFYYEEVKRHPRVKCFEGGWQDYDTNLCKNKRVLLIDDGSHRYQEVLYALNKFKKFIPVNSYMIVEDGNALDVTEDKERRKWLQGGPLRAIMEFIGNNDEFRVDYRWCDMFGINSTYNTYGYLKRVK